MKAFFPTPRGIDRDAAMKALRANLGAFLNDEVALYESPALEFPLGDFYAATQAGRLYVIRWIGAEDFAGRLTQTLGAWARMHGRGRTRAARAFDLTEDFPPAVLILLCDRIEEEWNAVLSTLSVPVLLLRVHAVSLEPGEPDGFFFEVAFGASPGMSPPARLRPRSSQSDTDAPGSSDSRSGMVKPTLSVGSDSHSGNSPLPDEAGGLSGAPPQPGAQDALVTEEWIEGDCMEKPPAEPASAVAERGDPQVPGSRADSLSPDSAPPSESPKVREEISKDWEVPEELLTDEEAATFRLLENVLQN